MENKISYRQDFSFFSDVLRAKKILLTGGSGFFGKNLIELFKYGNAKFGWRAELITVSRGEIPEDQALGHWHQVHDLQNPFAAKMPEKIDYIIHAASPLNQGSESPIAVRDAIITSMKNVLEYAKRSSAKSVLFTSSGAVYGPQPTNLSHVPETFTPTQLLTDPQWAYGNAKRDAENLGFLAARQNNFRFTSARCFALSGRHLPLDKHFALGNFVGNLLRNEPIEVKGDARTVRSYLDSEDLIFWLLKILLSGKTQEAYNVGSDQAISIGDLAKMVDSFREKSAIHFASGDVSGPISSYVPAIEKAVSELGLEIKTSLRDSIQKMIGFHYG